MLIPAHKNFLFRNIFVFLMFLCTSSSLFAQKSSPEQLLMQLKELRSRPDFETKDTTNIVLLNELGFAIRFKNLDTVLLLGQEALQLSKLVNYKKGEAASIITIADFYGYSGNPELAIEYALGALEISIPNGFFKESTKAYNTLGKAYFQQTDYPNSYKSFLKGAASAENMLTKELLMSLNMNIGTMYSLLQDYEEAIVYYDKALLSANKYNEEQIKWQIKSNIAYLQSNMGLYDKAIININESIDYFSRTHLKQWLAFNYTTKGGIYLKQDKFENARIYYQKAKSVHETLQDGKGKADVIYGQAAAYYGLNELEFAEKFAKESLEMYQKMQIKTGIQKSYTTLYKINEAKNNATRALHFLKLARELSDTIARESNKTNLKMLRTKLEFEKEKEVLQELNGTKIEQQRSITSWVVFALFGSLLFGYVIFKANKREKRLNKQLHDKTADLESREIQMHDLNTTHEKLFSIVGHDLKGPISSLKELLKIMSNEDDKVIIIRSLLPKLNNYTEHVYFTLENLLNWGKNQMKGENITPARVNLHKIASSVIALYSEAILKKELHLELCIDQGINAWIDEEDVNIIIRNLISNAIKFTPSNGNIKITAKAAGNSVHLEFIDSGVGMSLKTQKIVFYSHQHYSTFGTNNEKGTGLGLMLCKTLTARNNGKISVLSDVNNGTTIAVILPISN